MFSSAISTSDKYLSEIANKIKTTNNKLCCISSNIGNVYIPVYEFAEVTAPLIGNNLATDELYYEITTTDLVIGKYPLDLANSCGDFSTISDSVISLKYEDTFGHYKESVNTITISFAGILSKTGTGVLTVILNSGFIYSIKLEISTNGSGEPFIKEISPSYSNSNTNSQNLFVNILAFQKPIKDLLEVWQNGVFVEYLDVETHSPYIPTYCLSYDPVQPFKTFDEESLRYQFNNARHVYLNNNQSITIPANTVHEVSFSVMGGTGIVSVNGTSVTLPIGTKDVFTATGLINYAIVITAPTGVSNYCYVKIMEP